MWGCHSPTGRFATHLAIRANRGATGLRRKGAAAQAGCGATGLRRNRAAGRLEISGL